MTDSSSTKQEAAAAAPTETSVPAEVGSAADAVDAKSAEAQQQDAGLFGWRGLSGGLNSLFGGGEEEGESREVGKASPSILPLQKAASEMAASATSELESAGKAAQARLGQAAQELERGWGSLNMFLDDFLSPPVEDGNTSATAATREVVTNSVEEAMEGAAERLRERFSDVGEGEEAIDVYECALVQKYRCALNNSTPEKTFSCRGVLYVTSTNLRMYVVEDGGMFGTPFGVTVAIEKCTKVQRGSKAMLRIVTDSQSSYVFAAFESDDTFKAAAQLLHHLVDGDEVKEGDKES